MVPESAREVLQSTVQGTNQSIRGVVPETQQPRNAAIAAVNRCAEQGGLVSLLRVIRARACRWPARCQRRGRSADDADGAQIKPSSVCALSASSADKPFHQPAGQAIASANPGNTSDSSSACALAIASSSRSNTPLTGRPERWRLAGWPGARLAAVLPRMTRACRVGGVGAPGLRSWGRIWKTNFADGG